MRNPYRSCKANTTLLQVWTSTRDGCEEGEAKTAGGSTGAGGTFRTAWTITQTRWPESPRIAVHCDLRAWSPRDCAPFRRREPDHLPRGRRATAAGKPPRPYSCTVPMDIPYYTVPMDIPYYTVPMDIPYGHSLPQLQGQRLATRAAAAGVYPDRPEPGDPLLRRHHPALRGQHPVPPVQQVRAAVGHALNAIEITAGCLQLPSNSLLTCAELSWDEVQKRPCKTLCRANCRLSRPILLTIQHHSSRGPHPRHALGVGVLIANCRHALGVGVLIANCRHVGVVAQRQGFGGASVCAESDDNLGPAWSKHSGSGHQLLCTAR